MGFGKRLGELIKYRKTTVYQVAKATGIQKQTLYMMIKRDSNSTDMNTMGLLANALDVNISYFYDENYNIDENGITHIDNTPKSNYLSFGYLSGHLLIKKEYMNLLFLMSENITAHTRGKLFPTDILTLYLTAYFRSLFDNINNAFWEQAYVTIHLLFTEYPEFYISEIKLKYHSDYEQSVSNFLSENRISDNELLEYLYKSILQDYVNLHLKDHILYDAPCIQELVNWKAPFLVRKEK